MLFRSTANSILLVLLLIGGKLLGLGTHEPCVLCLVALEISVRSLLGSAVIVRVVEEVLDANQNLGKPDSQAVRQYRFQLSLRTPS